RWPRTGRRATRSGLRLRLRPRARFHGIAFNMVPDPRMPDGDRCVFLEDDPRTGFSCRWHGMRAQPAACAPAPLVVEPRFSQLEPTRFFYQRSRVRWCGGMRRAMRGEVPKTTARKTLNANYGWERLREMERMQASATAHSGWTPTGVEPFSPLARLFVDAVPELEDYLRGL
ncbi:MAG TPA: hypothetical protein VF178_03250, partial [Gemmatimonadaceae bacterium]